jgi:hypothetical protein
MTDSFFDETIDRGVRPTGSVLRPRTAKRLGIVYGCEGVVKASCRTCTGCSAPAPHQDAVAEDVGDREALVAAWERSGVVEEILDIWIPVRKVERPGVASR